MTLLSFEFVKLKKKTTFLMPWWKQACFNGHSCYYVVGDYTFYNLVLMTIVYVVFLGRPVNPVYKFLALALE